MRVLHSWTDVSAIIAVEGLSRPLRVLHLTDSHVALIDERDAEFIPFCRGLGNRFLPRHQNRDEQGRYFVGSDTAETLAFVRLVAGAENLLAILCGHIHFAHVDSISPQAVQYVGGPGFAGAYRLLELRPR